MRRFALLSLLVLTAMPAWAGAWLRQKDEAFSAAAVSVVRQADQATGYKSSLYTEWGLRSTLTIGLDAEERHDLRGHALIFGRVSLADFGRKGRVAAEFGAGVHHNMYKAWALYKGVLSYGKGFQSRWGNGWIAVDAGLELRTHEALFRKLDLTAGLSANRLLNPLLQIETTYVSDRPFHWRVRPSVIIRPKGRKSAWILGLERASNQNATGGRFGWWSTF